MENNRVSELFANKTILITGGTGFLGKVLIEKLLRSCSTLKKIYVIARGKKDQDPHQRLRDILKGPLFDLVRKEHGCEIFEKVEAVYGDVASLDLQLAPEDRRRLVEETEIIYHSAASVKFDDPLKDAVFMNVRGTKLMLELAKECKKLMVFCYVSTAYCHETQEVVYEKVYAPPIEPRPVISTCEWMNEETLEAITPSLRGNHANNYTFTKALAEALVEEEMGNLPVIIQRPSAVIPVFKEPIPGWTDNINGPVGIFLGAGKGVIRTMYARKDLFINCFPVDCVVNGLILSTYDFCTNGSRRVFHAVTTSEEAAHLNLTCQHFVDICKQAIRTTAAFSVVVWYPGGSPKESRILHYLAFFFFQLLPALVIDGILLIIGMKPFLLRVQKKIWKSYKIFEYHANRKWEFQRENYDAIQKSLNQNEKDTFYTSIKDMDMHNYVGWAIIGLRRYILKEPDEDIPAALKRMRMLRYLDLFCKFGLLFLIFYSISKYLMNYLN